ncbi:GNAT superfamily N-acetyltransferase [Paenibacillus sp. JGP012]|uniref:GNAT family N-acetyltransferase n=1 Tax=Paenibacillus sp. JGP012 TaxID=2735914 RepID=UPI00160724DC|nr:GNAT family N-acetyltransferase [Paenibacillus sp. JGP012]MBB6022254.1 GNAT superfamily N-acetyltransferase [Paenibacillus sp. JGP012]
MTLRLQSAVEGDLPILAEMNKQLIEDEKSSNPMGMKELEERMRQFFGDWEIDLIMKEDGVVGYVLYQYQVNSHNSEGRQVYIRQYCIRRECRKMGYGIAGIELLKKTRLKDVKRIEIDVLETNPDGKRFWNKAGFKPYYTNMRMET